ncbi:hypothetical protein RJT34_04744 [Clitoria ternatea]|uniref:Uncharacterized protein n=1 Tax=Clitoria ternatea TaxID=43366 RepID=A0AAN9Q0U2_CLITE
MDFETWKGAAPRTHPLVSFSARLSLAHGRSRTASGSRLTIVWFVSDSVRLSLSLTLSPCTSLSLAVFILTTTTTTPESTTSLWLDSRSHHHSRFTLLITTL